MTLTGWARLSPSPAGGLDADRTTRSRGRRRPSPSGSPYPRGRHRAPHRVHRRRGRRARLSRPHTARARALSPRCWRRSGRRWHPRAGRTTGGPAARAASTVVGDLRVRPGLADPRGEVHPRRPRPPAGAGPRLGPPVSRSSTSTTEQNLFDAATNFAGEWQVDETLAALASEGLALIAVGIPNGGDAALRGVHAISRPRQADDRRRARGRLPALRRRDREAGGGRRLPDQAGACSDRDPRLVARRARQPVGERPAPGAHSGSSAP